MADKMASNIHIEEVSNMKNLIREAEQVLLNSKREKNVKDKVVQRSNKSKIFMIVENIDYQTVVKTAQAFEDIPLHTRGKIDHKSFSGIQQVFKKDKDIGGLKIENVKLQSSNYSVSNPSVHIEPLQQQKIATESENLTQVREINQSSDNNNNTDVVNELLEQVMKESQQQQKPNRVIEKEQEKELMLDELSLKNEKEVREFKNLYQQAKSYDLSISQVQPKHEDGDTSINVNKQADSGKKSILANFSYKLLSVLDISHKTQSQSENINKNLQSSKTVKRDNSFSLFSSNIKLNDVSASQTHTNAQDKSKETIKKVQIAETELQKVSRTEKMIEKGSSNVSEQINIKDKWPETIGNRTQSEATDLKKDSKMDELQIRNKINSLSDGELLAIAMNYDFKLYTDLGEGRIDADEFRQRVRELAYELELKKLKGSN
ncbi:MAG: hypothetical protein N3E37_02755 [Candidatus Micrarchaeota archaeon]|nr:hypothetical protein [Candidatus Micrarchaeota archaeon]